MIGYNMVILYGVISSRPLFSENHELEFRISVPVFKAEIENFKVRVPLSIIEKSIALIHENLWILLDGRLVTNTGNMEDREPYILLKGFTVTTISLDRELGIQLPRLEKFNNCFD